jgi:hypothetical protein
VEAHPFSVRAVGYFALAVVVLDLLVSGAVLTLLRHDRFLWVFAATLLASCAALAVVMWVGVVVWHATISRSRSS